MKKLLMKFIVVVDFAIVVLCSFGTWYRLTHISFPGVWSLLYSFFGLVVFIFLVDILILGAYWLFKKIYYFCIRIFSK